MTENFHIAINTETHSLIEEKFSELPNSWAGYLITDSGKNMDYWSWNSRNLILAIDSITLDDWLVVLREIYEGKFKLIQEENA